MRIGIAITRATALDSTWTTVALASEALCRGWTVCVIEPSDWQVDPDSTVRARCHELKGKLTPDQVTRALVHRLADRTIIDVTSLDLLLLRANPLTPTVLAFARLAQERGVSVVNDPAALITVAHKGWLAAQPDVPTPKTLITRSKAMAASFLLDLPQGAVVKPARGSGGRGISRVAPRDTEALDQAVTVAGLAGDGHVVVQAWLPESSRGEKRVIWLDGEVLGGYLRQRAPGEFRHNLKHGGVPHPTRITEQELAAVARLSPRLQAAGVRLAGLDLIGAWITEVNALNPGGVHHANRLSGKNLARPILDRLVQPAVAPREPWALRAP